MNDQATPDATAETGTSTATKPTPKRSAQFLSLAIGATGLVIAMLVLLLLLKDVRRDAVDDAAADYFRTVAAADMAASAEIRVSPDSDFYRVGAVTDTTVCIETLMKGGEARYHGVFEKPTAGTGGSDTKPVRLDFGKGACPA